MEQTPKANRIHIAFFGRCNAGKSTLINMLTDQPVSLVSDVAGTTTDPVSKAMEILPLGPVVITDTAGIDDTTELGALRMEKTEEVVKKINLAVYVLRTDEEPTSDDMHWLGLLKQNNVPVALFINEINAVPNNLTESKASIGRDILGERYIADYMGLSDLVTVIGSADFTSDAKRLELLDLLGGLTALDVEGEQTLLQGLVEEGDTIILVCPIDSAAPKGRLILPQVQTIREILDHKGLALVCQTEELPAMIHSLKNPPKMVICDSQAFDRVDELTPDSIPLTSFSILMARFKGKLQDLVTGVKAIKNLKAGSKVLISEGCTHRRQCDDIGTVKIPNLLKKQGHTDLQLEFTSGGAFPKDVSQYDLIIHCGACMLTRREVLRRIECAVVQGTPIVNYGVLIASLHGILERAISPFVDELEG
ncbi:[FeFe] hydrogenase H-cluster maturation GTPase HydF [Veillonella parvula]|uniref:[FeFe] hydrogenase H-cluster maturation GTPase HydF n=1 Tax=Veillonella parvula TaxID=29466 RepID=UPI001D087B50|nr:[FeFe] hydrogenase H-cluster maturation GTPase HydF [Veillonella parvula]MCB7450569.1 [FeFe] hydrogenase H-cluster maturation GTPase HydF [Veillonella parvula]MCQ4955736.1 [FeFe] hydrogenase H-cluster maturation GTPase HydF [Veillonella parvula]MCQ4977262.1 [FeFe] hydrogenase H-cluster maturation GTPase HydF [Veillonella parvula]